MADSSLSASELRRRYHKGGELPDEALSASQLRARAGIASNKRDFSTGDAEGGAAGGGSATILVGIVLLVVAGLVGAKYLGLF